MVGLSLIFIICLILLGVKNHLERVYVANKWANEAVIKHNRNLGVPLKLEFTWVVNRVEPVFFPGYVPPQKEKEHIDSN